MKATELRLGSLFDYKQCIYAANVIRDNFVYGKNVNGFAPGEFPIDKINSIPLTEEWLLKFGFEKDNELNFVKFSFKVHFWSNYNSYMYGWIGGNIEIKYVHQLQNIYFALTGQELTIQKQSKLSKMFGKQK